MPSGYLCLPWNGRGSPVDRERYCKQLRCAGKPGNKKNSTFLHSGTLEKRQHARCRQDTYALNGKGVEGDRVCERIVYPDTYPGKNQSFCSYRTGQQTVTCIVFPPIRPLFVNDNTGAYAGESISPLLYFLPCALADHRE